MNIKDGAEILYGPMPMPIRDPEMQLPDGYTCADCFAFYRFCQPLGISTESRTECDYAPSRFSLSQEKLREFAKLKKDKKELKHEK